MIRAALLAAVALAAVATAQAQSISIVQRPDGLWACSNDPTRIVVNGDWRIACLADVPQMTPEQSKAFIEQWHRAHPQRDAN